MRRWNGWGDDGVAYTIQPRTMDLIGRKVGTSPAPSDVHFADIVAQVTPSRLAPHPLISTDAAIRVRHTRGQSLPDLIALRSGIDLIFPEGVAYPESCHDVKQLIRYAQATGVHLIPYGGGTSVVGHINVLSPSVPVLTVDLSRLNTLQMLDETSDLATFGTGISGAHLEASLRARGYTLGHFPQSFEYSTLGGWIATRSRGQQSVYYGGIERLFAGGRLETPIGSVEFPPMPASSAGLDLREIVLGSEGRIGIITEATMRVSRLPDYEAFRAVFFPNFEQGAAAVRQIVQARLPFSMLRLSDAAETELTLSLGSHQKMRHTLEWLLKQRGCGDEKCMLMIGVTGNARLAGLTLNQILAITREHSGIHLIGGTLGKQWRKSRFRTPYLRNSLWELGYAVDTIETAVDWMHVPATIKAIRSALTHGLEALGERVYVLIHLSHVYTSGSSIYATYLFRTAPDLHETLWRWKVLKDTASHALMEEGATISHQHGVGVDHLPYMADEKGEQGMSLIRSVCAHFDPKGMMNPGKLFD
jgi:alkyldihydroxyacetonephosphate synthase